MATPDLNHVTVSGSAETKPSVVTLASGTKLCMFTIKNTERYTQGDGRMGVHHNFLTIETLGKQADRCLLQVRPGRRYIIDGYLRSDVLNEQEQTRVRAYSVREE